MKILFLCLANSKKYNERCVAGIQIEECSDNKYSMVKENNRPKWIRPVSCTSHGEIPTIIAKNIKLLDIVEMDVISKCPNGYQSENVKIDERTLTKKKSLVVSSESLNKIITPDMQKIFLNQGKAVINTEVNKLNHSLVFVKPQECKFIKVSNQYVKGQLRVEFKYNKIIYNLPITDLDFLDLCNKNPNIINTIKDIYFTISLGIEFEGWHYKLVAGVIFII